MHCQRAGLPCAEDIACVQFRVVLRTFHNTVPIVQKTRLERSRYGCSRERADVGAASIDESEQRSGIHKAFNEKAAPERII